MVCTQVYARAAVCHPSDVFQHSATFLKPVGASVAYSSPEEDIIPFLDHKTLKEGCDILRLSPQALYPQNSMLIVGEGGGTIAAFCMVPKLYTLQ
jgi:hypothetical protein